MLHGGLFSVISDFFGCSAYFFELLEKIMDDWPARHNYGAGRHNYGCHVGATSIFCCRKKKDGTDRTKPEASAVQQGRGKMNLRGASS